MSKNFMGFVEKLKMSKIAIVGIGVSNVPLIKYLTELNCNITLFDKKEMSAFNKEIKEIINNCGLKTYFGDDYLENLIGFDVIFRSPSILPTNKYLQSEEERGALITTEVEQVIRFAPCPVIGITGSKGKTTTTTLISLLLSSTDNKIYVGGNIGTPLFTKIPEFKKEDIIVLELSSFQLMNMRYSPSISVVTNISPDHLDVHSNYDEYISAKKAIFSNQKSNDVVILNYDDEVVRGFSEEAIGDVIFFGKNIDNGYSLEKKFIKIKENDQEKILLDLTKLVLKGEHNYLNICAALAATRFFIKDENIQKCLQNFKGVEHRLEFVREINGVKWYNDSASTTPDKAEAGIRAFDEDVVLITGGSDKNISYVDYAKPILDKVSKLILFGQTKNKIYDAVMERKKKLGADIEIFVLDTLDEVVEAAYQVSKPGEVVLFSPASASFDMFKNAYQRGDLFKKKVYKL